MLKKWHGCCSIHEKCVHLQVVEKDYSPYK